MKNLYLCFIIVVILSITGCDLSPSYSNSDSGEKLIINSEKHFIENVTYTNGPTTETFRSDGTYQITTSRWDTTSSSMVPTTEIRGTYTWDSSNYQFITIETGRKSAGGTWLDYPAEEQIAVTNTELFATHLHQEVLTVSGDTYTSNRTERKSYGLYNETNEYTFTNNTLTLISTLKDPDLGLKIKVTFAITGTFPKAAQPSVGKQITYQVEPISFEYFDPTSLTWLKPSTFDLLLLTQFTHQNGNSCFKIALLESGYAVFADNEQTRKIHVADSAKSHD